MLPRSTSDYDRVASAIDFLVEHAERQPSLAEVAAHLRLSPFHAQRVFSRWAGVTPKRFLQVLTVERAKLLLRQSASLLEAADNVGLSSGSRLYDHFVQLEAVTPGEFKTGGAGLTIDYGVHATPFGPAFAAVTERGICRLAFLAEEGITAQVAELARAWPAAILQENLITTGPLVKAVFDRAAAPVQPLSLCVTGTNFQISVWRALLRIPSGNLVSYHQIARAIGRPQAARAVGSAVGANPVALLIPCHRVIQQSGALGGYRWGSTRKHALLAWEMAQMEPR